MAQNDFEFSIPNAVLNAIEAEGYPNPLSNMSGFISSWNDMLKANGSFWDYQKRNTKGHLYKIHRRTIHPARKVTNEWASLLLNDKTTINANDDKCTEYLEKFFASINFTGYGQGLIAKAFGLGTGAWVLWADIEKKEMQVRRYDARAIIPLSWDDDGVSECAFVSVVVAGGETLYQLQMHLLEDDVYVIKTRLFNSEGKEVVSDDMEPDFNTQSDKPWFAIVKPAIENTCVDMSPYGQSVFTDAIDALKTVDLSYDAIFNEMQLGQMRIFMSDVMFERKRGADGDEYVVPFGEDDDTVIRKVMSVDDTINHFAPTLRIDQLKQGYRLALQTMGDLCGFGLTYFDIDDSGGIRTATEVSSDNSALMRNIRKHENLLEGAIVDISAAVLHCARTFLAEPLPQEELITVNFDDSIITDTAAEKAQDMAEVSAGLMQKWEYRVKWYGESEDEAKANVESDDMDPVAYLEDEPVDEPEEEPEEDGEDE